MAKNVGISLYSRCIKVMDLDIQETKVVLMSIYINFQYIKIQHVSKNKCIYSNHLSLMHHVNCIQEWLIWFHAVLLCLIP
jgi:hypothetical protein